MANEKMQASNIIDSKNDGGILNSNIMKTLEDIDYDISQADFDNVAPDDLDGDAFKEIEKDVESYEVEKMEKLLLQEGLAIDDPVRMYLKDIGKIPLLSPEREKYLKKRYSIMMRYLRRLKYMPHGWQIFM